MAYSTCVKCGKTNFQISENTPSGSNYKLMFVQCSSCGGVAGVLDYYNIGAKIEGLEKKVDDIPTTSPIDLINRNLDIINKNVLSIIKTLAAKK